MSYVFSVSDLFNSCSKCITTRPTAFYLHWLACSVCFWLITLIHYICLLISSLWHIIVSYFFCFIGFCCGCHVFHLFLLVMCSASLHCVICFYVFGECLDYPCSNSTDVNRCLLFKKSFLDSFPVFRWGSITHDGVFFMLSTSWHVEFCASSQSFHLCPP